jgi:ABC-type multidrug transport system permease subunit
VLKPFINLVKYDFIAFFREPYFSLPLVIFPALLFYVFMSIFQGQVASLEGFDAYLPTYALLTAFMILFSNIGTQFVIEKQNGIHKRLVLSAINKKHLVLTYLVKGVFLSLLGLLEICLIARFVFGLQIPGHFPFFLLIYLVILTLVLLLSISLHDLFKSSKQVVPFTIVTFQYVLLCSGLMFPIKDAPDFLIPFIYLNPFYHMNEILTSVWSMNLSDISWLSVGYLIAVTLVCMLLVRYSSLKREA